MRLLCYLAFCFSCLFASPQAEVSGISFGFKGRAHLLQHKMQLGARHFAQKAYCNNACLDTLSNHYDVKKSHVEIVRQDNPLRPTIGLALAFEFDEENGDYPYTPAYAVLQLKNFGWGGVEFSTSDTLNYTGVSNAVSDDVTIEILDFQNDTITGTFYGLLLSGAGPMAAIDSGRFKVRLYRK